MVLPKVGLQGTCSGANENRIGNKPNIPQLMTYDELIKAKPKVLCECGKIRWVENPFCGHKPIIKIDRGKRTFKELNIFNEKELWLKRIGW